jgi:hypothetical protein
MAYSLLDGEDEGIGSDKRRDQGIDDWRNSGESEVEAGGNFIGAGACVLGAAKSAPRPKCYSFCLALTQSW